MESTLKSEQELKDAYKFSEGLRGQYIVAQALYHTIKVMEQVPEPHKEVSDISDMKYLQETVFRSIPPFIFEDTSTSVFHREMQEAHGSVCLHVVEDCETDESCQCGAVLT